MSKNSERSYRINVSLNVEGQPISDRLETGSHVYVFRGNNSGEVMRAISDMADDPSSGLDHIGAAKLGMQVIRHKMLESLLLEPKKEDGNSESEVPTGKDPRYLGPETYRAEEAINEIGVNYRDGSRILNMPGVRHRRVDVTYRWNKTQEAYDKINQLAERGEIRPNVRRDAARAIQIVWGDDRGRVEDKTELPINPFKVERAA